MKTILEKIKSKEMIPGFRGRFVHTDLYTIAFWEVDEGAILPEHSHVNIQSSEVTEGHFELTIDGVVTDCKPGAVVVVPSNAVHSGRAITACKITDIFPPARPEYSNE